MPVRKVVASASFLVRFASQKNGKVMLLESLVEYAVALLLEFEAFIRSFETQPLTIEYTEGGRLRTYTPDFLATTSTNERILIEARHSRRLYSEKSQPALAAAAEYCAAEGFEFLTFDERVRASTYHANVNLLSQAAIHRLPKALTEYHVPTKLLPKQGLRLSALADLLAPFTDHPVPHIHTLLYRHYLTADLGTHRLGPDSYVLPPAPDHEKRRPTWLSTGWSPVN